MLDKIKIFVLLIWGVLAPVCLKGSVSMLKTQDRVRAIYDENKNSVVRIKAALANDSVEQKLIKAKKAQQASSDIINTSTDDNKAILRIGTGIIISSEGHILTSASTVDEAQRVWVEFNDIAYSTEVVGVDKLVNIAILKVSHFPKDAKVIHIGTTSKQASVGTFLVNLSYPLNLSVTPKVGMLSGIDGFFDRHIFTTSYYRTDITLCPGASGSPFFDLDGSFIGLAIASLPEIQSSYMLPAKAIMRIRDDLIFSGKLSYGFVGIEVEQVSDIQKGLRILITQVIPDSPADLAGVRPGDQLIRFGEFDIETILDVTNAAFFAIPGQFTNVSVVRRGQTKNFPLKVTEQPIVDSLDEPGEITVSNEPKLEKEESIAEETDTTISKNSSEQVEQARQLEKINTLIQPKAA